MSRIRFKSKQPMGIGTRIIDTLFFFVFFATGTLFCAFIVRGFASVTAIAPAREFTLPVFPQGGIPDRNHAVGEADE